MIPKDQRSAWTQQKHRLSAELPPPDDLEQAFGICSFMIMYGHVGTCKGTVLRVQKTSLCSFPIVNSEIPLCECLDGVPWKPFSRNVPGSDC